MVDSLLNTLENYQRRKKNSYDRGNAKFKDLLRLMRYFHHRPKDNRIYFVLSDELSEKHKRHYFPISISYDSC